MCTTASQLRPLHENEGPSGLLPINNNSFNKKTLFSPSEYTVPTRSVFVPSYLKSKAELKDMLLDVNVWCYGNSFPSFIAKVKRQNEIDDQVSIFPAKLDLTIVIKDGVSQLPIKEFTKSAIIKSDKLIELQGAYIEFVD